ncbi:hypothetical protein RS030_111845 [Cryptosporidium xiaoi]|uniref:Mon2/Sec7/BIG1-like dimerisation and cyclophilin-binding domain-containing protein n=1 Tax=Cryptosporidium xiaoi TaxID=659607 RepID=A0AAV9Y1V1_9CRYT
MKRISTLELLESLYNDFQEKIGTTNIVNSGEILENKGIKILKDLHGSKNPFGTYKNENLTQSKNKLKLNNPLSYIIRRLTEELFSIVTTVRYPILLTPNLYVIYISLLCELGMGELPPLFLDTYEGYIDNFDINFVPLLIEIYIRRSPLWGLVKNINFCIDNIYMMSSNIVDNVKLKDEFKEIQSTINLNDNELNMSNFLPLFFANIQSLKKGYKLGRYLLCIAKDKNKKTTKSINSLNNNNSNKLSLSLSFAVNRLFGGVKGDNVNKGIKENNRTSGINSNSTVDMYNKSTSKSGVKGKVSSEYIRKVNNNILDNFSLYRVSISLIITVFNDVGSLILYEDKINDFSNLLIKLEKSIAIIISGSYINDINNNPTNIETNNIYELDGSLSKDIFTIVNNVEEYKPFHYLHFQVISGLRILINGYNIIKNTSNDDNNNNNNNRNSDSGFYEAIMLYITRILTQVIKVIELSNNINNINSDQKHKFKHNYIDFENKIEDLNESDLKNEINTYNNEKLNIMVTSSKEDMININGVNKNYEHLNEITIVENRKNYDKVNLMCKFSSYMEIIPSEMILLIQDLIKSQDFSKNIIKSLIFELHELQIKNVINNNFNVNLSSLFIKTFVEYIRLKNKDEMDKNMIINSWKYIIEYYVYPNILNSYIVYLFCEMLSDNNVKETLNNLDINLFINSYFGILIRIIVYHPDISFKSILNVLLYCIDLLDKQKVDSSWLDNWIYITLMITCMPLMTLFPQKIESNISEIKDIVTNVKPNDRVSNLLLKLIYPGINSNYTSCSHSKSGLKSIICDLSVNILLTSIYNNNTNNNTHLESSYSFLQNNYLNEKAKEVTRKEININESKILNKNSFEPVLLLKNTNNDIGKSLNGTSYRLHTIIIIKKCLYIIDMLILKLINYIDRHIIPNNDISECFSGKIIYFLSEILDLFPYFFYQGGKYSLELQERFSKLIINIIRKKPEFLFENKIFNRMITCLKIEIYSNIVSISPLCWIIGEIILLNCNEELLISNDKKVLLIIESLKLILEKCYLNCVDLFSNISKLLSSSNTYFNGDSYDHINNLRLNHNYKYSCNDKDIIVDDNNTDINCYYNSNNEYYNDSFSESYSSDSSFLSDSSFNIDQEIFGLTDIENDVLYEENNYIFDKNNNFERNYNVYNHDNFNSDYKNSINLNEYNKYIEYMYLIDTSISSLLKIGVAIKHLKKDIIKILELFQKKFYEFYFKDKLVFNENNQNNYLYEYIQTSNIIVMKKLNKSIKILKYTSMFSSTLFTYDSHINYNTYFNNYPINNFVDENTD